MKNASTEAATKKMNCFGHYCFCVCMFIDFLFYRNFNRIPAKGFIPDLQSYVYKIFSAQIKVFRVFRAVFVYNLRI